MKRLRALVVFVFVASFVGGLSGLYAWGEGRETRRAAGEGAITAFWAFVIACVVLLPDEEE